MSQFATIAAPLWDSDDGSEFLKEELAGEENLTSSDIWGPRIVWLVAVSWGVGCVLGFQISVALLTLIGISFAVLGLARPSVALLGLGLLCTLDSVMRTYLMTGGLLRWNTLNYWLILFTLMAIPTLMKIKEIPAFILLSYISLMVLGLYFTPDRRRGILDLLNVVGAFGIFGYFLRAANDVRIWHWLGMINGSLAAFGGFVFYSQRSGLPKIDENGLSYFPLTAMFSICFAFPFSTSLRDRTILSMLAAINFFWVFLTGSRQGLLVGSVCLLFILTQLPGLGTRVLVICLAAVTGFAVLSQFTDLQDRTVRRVTKMFDNQHSMASRTSGRYDLMIGGWRIFRDNPMGVGTGGFPNAWKHLRDRRGLSDFVKGREFNCHSAWIKALTENGLPGITLLVCYVSSFVFIGWMRNSANAFKLGLLGTVILSLAFIATEFQVKGTWFFASAMTMLLSTRNSDYV